jgi:hypothetical protein
MRLLAVKIVKYKGNYFVFSTAGLVGIRWPEIKSRNSTKSIAYLTT